MAAGIHNALRLACAALCVAALAYQAGSLAEQDLFRPANFFSFFTVQSNILAAATFALVATIGARERPQWVDALRGAATLSMAITGIVFALLLAGLQEELQTHIAWVDFTLHKLLPVAVVLDWLVDPPRRRLPMRVAWLWLVYPVAYFVYSLVRGAIVEWYPYPFLDAGTIGYDGVAWRAAVLFAGMIGAAAAVAAIGNRLHDRRHGAEGEALVPATPG